MNTTTITTATTTTTTTTTTNSSMAPPTITSMNRHMATEPTTSTDSNTSSEVNGGGEVTDSKLREKLREERLRKQSASEKNRLTNIRGEYLRLKEMIPSIKNVDGIETSEGKMLTAFDTEARYQTARRHMLLKRVAYLEQLINNA